MNDNTERNSAWFDLPEEKRDLLDRRLRGERSGKASSKITPRIEQNHYPLSFSQTGIWLASQYEQDNFAYNDIRALRLKGSLNVSALERSLNKVVVRHEILRSNYTSFEGIPQQTIREKLEIGISLSDLRHLPPTERETGMNQLAKEAAQRPFDLAADPLVRALLYRLGDDEHAFVLIIHNIICDGISVSVLYKELASNYSAITKDCAVPTQKLTIRYADFASWQRKRLQGERLEKLIAYWRRQLAGMPQSLNLPTDRPRPRIQTYNGTGQMLILTDQITSALKDLSIQEDITLFMTLLAAFKILIQRYAQQDDIVISTLISNRNRLELEPLIGLFVNTLLLRTSLEGDPTFVELLERVRDMTLSAYDYQDLPFEKLIEDIQPHRDLSRNPLFQVLFNFKNKPTQPFELDGVKADPFLIDTGKTHFDLTVEVFDHSDELHCLFEYNSDLYENKTIQRMLGHFETLLKGIVDDPNQRLSELPILKADERNQLLVEWNNTRIEFDRDQTIHQLFEAQVERTPDAVALVSEGEELTFRNLNARSNQLANYLQSLAVGPESLVGISIERSLNMIIGLLGILKTGGTYVPMDPKYPASRLAFMLNDTNPHVLLTNRKFADNFSDYETQVICLDDDWGKINQANTENPICEVSTDNLAYVLYTSGSTGRPKGVLGLHKGAVNRFYWMWETYPFETEETCCLVTSINFVDSVWEIFGPLLQGIRLVLIPDAAVEDPRLLVDQLAKYQVSRIVLVPSLLSELLAIDDLEVQLPYLRHWISSGEALAINLVKQFNKILPKCTLVNLYGSTEVSADVTYYPVRKDESETLRIPIGTPIANTQIYLLDRNLNPVPVGVPGKLFVGGDGVARGYLNQPGLTREHFIPNPFGTEDHSILYDTGDIARYLPNGNLDLLGRADRQVKIRGFRVELEEVESVLVEHPSIMQAAVMSNKRISGDQRLIAYIALVTGLSLSTDDVLHHLRENLPNYMIPAAFVYLDELPLTSSGKVDRMALIDSGTEVVAAKKTYSSPRDELESQLIKIWEQILEVDHIGADDNFFDLGGHSLLAARLFAQIEKESGYRLPLATLFQAPTVSELASKMRVYAGGGWSPLVAIQSDGSKPPLFCAAALGGNALTYRDLALKLGPDQPVFALQAQGLDGYKQPINRVEDLAAYYINGILAQKPEGPYYLCGTSFGGLVAYEMGRQLFQLGKEVAVVAMFDTYTPQFAIQWYRHDRPKYRYQAFLDRVQLHLSNFMVADWKGKRRYINAKRLRFLRKFRKKKWLKRSQIRNDLRGRIGKVESESRRALRSYQVQAFPGRVVLIRASHHPRAMSQDPTLGWAEILGDNLEIYEVSGHHGTLTYEPRAGGLAEMLTAVLDAN